MQKIILGLFISLLTISSLNATDTKTISDDDFMKQFMQLEKRQQNTDNIIIKAKEKTKVEKAKTRAEKQKTKNVYNYGKTVNKLAKTVGTNK